MNWNINRLVVAILLAFPFLFSALSAQTLKVNQRNGNQIAYTLSNIQKMTFQDGNVNIQEKDECDYDIGYH